VVKDNNLVMIEREQQHNSITAYAIKWFHKVLELVKTGNCKEISFEEMKSKSNHHTTGIVK